MLRRYSDPFLEYVAVADFSKRSIATLTDRINEFENFLTSKRLRSVKNVAYPHLVEFTAEFRSPSIHITKSPHVERGTLRQVHVEGKGVEVKHPSGLRRNTSYVVGRLRLCPRHQTGRTQHQDAHQPPRFFE